MRENGGRGDRNRDSNHDKRRKDDEFQWKKASKTGLIWIAILLAAIIFSVFWPGSDRDGMEISFSEYKEILKQDNIRSVIVKENTVIGILRQPLPKPGNEGRTFTRFKTILPLLSEDMVEEWEAMSIMVKVERPSNEWTVILSYALPWILILLVLAAGHFR